MTLKTLMLGLAAAATATTAQAADLPVAPEPVDYVRICDAYGARYYYIPGTETCLRVGGRVRTQFVIQNVMDNNAGWGVRNGNGYSWLTRGYLWLRAYTNTEFGLLHARTELALQVSDAAEGFDFGSTYIQWGGLTAGYLGSQFDHFTGQAAVGVVTRNWSDTTTQQLAYTASFGDGFYVTGSIEDRQERDTGTAGGSALPDFVAAIGVNQGWGSAKLSGAVHQVLPNNANKILGASADTGWAVGASVGINLPMLASGSNVYFQGFYADGAMSYIGAGDVVVNGATVSVDDYNVSGTNKGWSLSAGLYHQATSNIGLALDGSYLNVDISGTNNDVTRWALDGSVQWVPVSGFKISGDVGYSNTDVDNVGDLDELLFGVRLERDF